MVVTVLQENALVGAESLKTSRKIASTDCVGELFGKILLGLA
jgi:hypothetical protein